MDYTRAQREAIATIHRPLLIVACAGSGKTQVISQRIVEILKRPGVEPRNVVAFTFTDKAAAELKERVTTLVERDIGHVLGLADMFIGTMHGYARDLLQTYVPDTFKYQVLDEVQARLLVDRNSNKCGLSAVQVNVNGRPPRRLYRYTESKVYLQAMNILREDAIKEQLLPESLVDAADMYAILLHQHSYFDFTELLKAAVDLLAESPGDEMAGALVRHIRDDLRYVVVDEYQDTNHIQERLIRGLTRFGANLCVVGDDDQTIYQWRGSAVANILTFAQRHKGVRTVTLDDNFRSSKGVVAVAQAVAEENFDKRLPKKMVASSGQEYARSDILALTFDSPDDEAGWIVDRIERLRGISFRDDPGSDPRGLSWSDFAVLFRSVSHDAGPLVDELKRRNIPYLIKGLTKLFEAPEVKACVASFKYLNWEADLKEVRAAWLASGLGLGRDDVARGIAFLDRLMRSKSDKRWAGNNIQRVYLELLEKLGVREDRVPSADGRVRGELAFYTLGKFSQAISDFEEINFRSDPDRKYTSFVRWLKKQAPDYYADGGTDVGYATPDAVTIATVHQAKGMQWPAVFVPAMRRNRIPSKRAGGLNVFHLIPAGAVEDAERYRGTVPDERRLFYVALTRAQKWLAVTFSPGGRPYQNRSEFFDFVTRNPYVLTAEPPLRNAKRPQAAPTARDAGGHVQLQRAEVPVRVPVRVQAAIPLWIQPAHPRGARLWQVRPRHDGGDPQEGHRRGPRDRSGDWRAGRPSSAGAVRVSRPA